MTTAPTILAGAQLDRAPGPKYVDALGFAELAPQAPLPRPETLRSWRERMPEGFVASLVAPRATVASRRGPLRFDDDLTAGVTWLLEAAEALEVRALVVPTDSDTTTGQRDRDLLRAYFEKLAGAPGKVFWAPSGLWEPEDALPFARRLGVSLTCDPLEQQVPREELVVARLKALGGRQRFGEAMLEDVIDALTEAGPTTALVAIESPRSFKEASRLAQLIAARAE